MANLILFANLRRMRAALETDRGEVKKCKMTGSQNVTHAPGVTFPPVPAGNLKDIALFHLFLTSFVFELKFIGSCRYTLRNLSRHPTFLTRGYSVSGLSRLNHSPIRVVFRLSLSLLTFVSHQTTEVDHLCY